MPRPIHPVKLVNSFIIRLLHATLLLLKLLVMNLDGAQFKMQLLGCDFNLIQLCFKHGNLLALLLLALRVADHESFVRVELCVCVAQLLDQLFALELVDLEHLPGLLQLETLVLAL